ncbi:PhzF family phenazine biosynthesis protein [Amycolatopsis sacchari]|uniref:PhzF family phenazine biosynthesis protein n=1 Tax=Amycolatopsis sacchari TaxID=115433 RepID=UPI003D724271
MQFHTVDAFADGRFAGNPAAVAPVPEFPPVPVMQEAAHRIGLPTTAFVVPRHTAEYGIRWFTPYAEINLCGHATIASARYLFTRPENAGQDRLTFVSDNGILHAEREDDLVGIDLPAAPVTPADPPPGLLAALGVEAVACHVSSDDVLVEVASPEAVSAVRPDFGALARLPFRGHIVTAAGGADFVSRTFFPSLGVDEDQVCVTAHAKLTPYWAARLGRERLTALQLSERGGRLLVEDAGDRVRVLGTAVPRPGTGELEHIDETRGALR